MMLALLQILNGPSFSRDTIQKVIHSIKQFSGIGEAGFGISEERLVDDADVVKGGEAFGLWQALAGIIDGFILSKAKGG